jgi:hypothetical protein
MNITFFKYWFLTVKHHEHAVKFYLLEEKDSENTEEKIRGKTWTVIFVAIFFRGLHFNVSDCIYVTVKWETAKACFLTLNIKTK